MSSAAAIATGSVAADTAAGSSIVGPDSTATMTNVVTKEAEMNEITATPTTPFLEENNASTTNIATTAAASVDTKDSLRVVRLEQNRKAASESRKRKRILLDELQRSVIFFTRANDTLKQQNQNLQTLLQQAQNQIKNIDDKSEEVTTGANESKATKATTTNPSEQSSHDDDDKKKTMHLPIQIPPAQVPLQISSFLNTVETGATIQAMTNFQQAASAAMKAALHHMQQQYNDNNGETDHSISGIQQQHQSLFEIATLTVPTTTTKATSTAAAKSSTVTDASTNENKSEL